MPFFLEAISWNNNDDDNISLYDHKKTRHYLP